MTKDVKPTGGGSPMVLQKHLTAGRFYPARDLKYTLAMYLCNEPLDRVSKRLLRHAVRCLRPSACKRVSTPIGCSIRKLNGRQPFPQNTTKLSPRFTCVIKPVFEHAHDYGTATVRTSLSPLVCSYASIQYNRCYTTWYVFILL